MAGIGTVSAERVQKSAMEVKTKKEAKTKKSGPIEPMSWRKHVTCRHHVLWTTLSELKVGESIELVIDPDPCNGHESVRSKLIFDREYETVQYFEKEVFTRGADFNTLGETKYDSTKNLAAPFEMCPTMGYAIFKRKSACKRCDCYENLTCMTWTDLAKMPRILHVETVTGTDSDSNSDSDSDC